MPITAQSLINRAQTTLMDETGVRWNSTELTRALNDGQREIVMLKPDAYSINAVLSLVAGTKQTIDSAGVILLDVIRNLGTDGLTAGRVVTRQARGDLDATRPNWHAEATSDEVLHYIFDERDPTHFYVFPPQPAITGSVEYVYSASPAEIVEPSSDNGAVSGDISIGDIYQTSLFYYMMFRAHSKESQNASPEKASAYYQLFSRSVTGKEVGEAKSGTSAA